MTKPCVICGRTHERLDDKPPSIWGVVIGIVSGIIMLAIGWFFG